MCARPRMERPKHSNIFDWLCMCVCALEHVCVSIIGLRVHHAQSVVSIQLADSYYTFFFIRMTSIRFDCWKCDISCPVRVLFPIKIASVIHFSLLLLLFCIFIIIVDVIIVRQRLSNIYLGGRLDVLKQIELNVDVCVNTFQFELCSTDHFSSHSYRLPIRVSLI